MKRAWALFIVIALLAGTKFALDYFYFDTKGKAAYRIENPPTKILQLPDAPTEGVGEIEISPESIQQALFDLGIPVGDIDGKWGPRTRQAFCIWRELTGRTPDRNYPIDFELREIAILAKVKEEFKLSQETVPGLNINRTCQSVIWVKNKVANEYEISTVSTGAPATPTEVGDFKVTWKVDRWYESISIPDGWMYRPMFFNKGQAVHGSEQDAFVWWYPASHGCVRMLGAFVDKLWASGFGVGDKVRVYGDWNPYTKDPETTLKLN